MAEEETSEPVLPEVTTERKSEARTLLENVEENNGHLAIAHQVGLARSQVKEIHKEMLDELEVEE